MPLQILRQRTRGAQNLEWMVPKCLRKNAKLHRELASGQQRVLTQTSAGEPQHILTIPLDGARLDELCAMITRGLIWYHWQVFLSSGAGTRAFFARMQARKLLS